ncbi:MAG: DUF551 domain-containing protein [Eikenella corrodens]|uniref:DUF551 domain-containing protein n=1 Tax=Eikenella corrodens TaxID=539 RepID=UPI00360AEAD6
MTPERIEQERKAFEEWYINYLPPDSPIQYFSRDYTGYRTYRTRVLFEGWLARAAQSEWISVEERLPEAHDDILVYTCDGDIYPITAMRRDITWIGISGATHWQPFPAPPITNPAA